MGGFVGAAISPSVGYTEDIVDCYATGEVNGGTEVAQNVGGFVGTVASRINFVNCYSTGKPTGSINVGGFCGDVTGSDVTATNCFWDIETSETIFSALGTGKTTREMQTQSTFTGWDFENIWIINPTEETRSGWTYPQLMAGYGETNVERAGGAIDCNGAMIIRDLLTNVRYGGRIPESFINDTSFNIIKDYCTAKDYNFSFVLNDQKSIWDWIDYIRSHFKGYVYMSNGLICLGAYRDESAVFEITRDDLVVSEGENPPPPVNVKTKSFHDSVNKIVLAWSNCDKNYDISTVTAGDEVYQRATGKIRSKNIQMDGITNSTLAQEMAYRQLFENLYRFKFYTFTLSYKSMSIGVGDVGTLSDGYMISEQRIRILKINEIENGKLLQIEAVEDKPYLYRNVSYDSATTEHEQQEEPTLTSPEIEFTEHPLEPILGISIIPQDEWSAEATGSPAWIIYYSWQENGTYKQFDTHHTASTKGTLSTALPAEPAVIHKPLDSFVVDVGDYGLLEDATDADFFNNRQLARIGNEIIAYKLADRIGATNEFTITNLIRGLFNTDAVAHSVGETFVTISDAFPYIYNAEDIGKTIYFKILTYYGETIQQLEDVTAHSHTITGEYKRPAPASLLRIWQKEGYQNYQGITVDIDWYLASKTGGFNIGGYNNILDSNWVWGDDEADLVGNEGLGYGNYVADSELERVHLQIEELDGTFIAEKILDADDEREELSIIDDFDFKNPVRIKIIPARSLQSTKKASIIVNRLAI